MYKIFSTMLLSISSLPAFAHAGHDHGDLTASLIHLFWLAPVIIGVVIITYKLNKNDNAKNNVKR